MWSLTKGAVAVTAAVVLTAQQREDFRELGFFHVGRVFDDAELAEIRREYDRCLERPMRVAQPGGDAFDYSPLLQLQSPTLCSYASSPGLVAIALELLGPDIRLYWDTTTSGDPLRWTLNQFQAGNLKKMIERAGYPTVAYDLDEDLLQSMLPEIERRAFELVSENKPAQAGVSDQRKTKAQLIQELEVLREQVAALEA